MMPSAGLAIRPAAPDDAPAIAALLGELGYPAEPRAVIARMARLSAADDLVLVAQGADGPVAVATVHLVPLFHRDARLARITAFVVSARSRGAGVGRALLRACEAWAAERGAERAEVTSGDAREGAHDFYASSGFVREGVRFTKPLAG